MALGTSNRDGGKTSESGHLRALAKMVNGDVIAGLAVSQRGAGANMSVDVAIGDAFVRRSDNTYAHPVFNDAVYNQVIAAADVSNPRRDLIVLYVDYGNAVSTAVSNNTNGVVKIKVVAGTPAGSPSDPSGAAIQASVGSGNPYTVLARVRVGAGVTTISNSVIDDLRSMITYDFTKVEAGQVIQSVGTQYEAAATGTTIIPFDDTIPQNTEGDQYMSQAITPKSATSKLLVTVSAWFSHSAANAQPGVALFKDSDANALAVGEIYENTGTAANMVTYSYEMVAGTTSPITFKVRIGSQAAGTLTFNGQSGSRRYGATAKSSLRIKEIRG